MRFAMIALAGFLLWQPLPLAADGAPLQPEATTAPPDTAPDRGTVAARDFMVVTAHPLASRAGYDILAAGGSAADAAVAVQLVLGLVEPQSSGLGGGGFVLYRAAADGVLRSFDARETAPAAAGPDLWLGPDGAPLPFWEAVIGGRSVGVPGVPLLLERLHAEFGRLPRADLVTPAISLAEQGFPVSQRLAAAVAAARGLDRQAAAREYFFPHGQPLAEGEVLRNPAYARVLRLFAAEGAAPFYRGALARDLVGAVRQADPPGLLTMDDLRAYRVIERPPVCVAYRGHQVCGMGPPSSGGLTVGQMLGLLERFDLAALGDGPEAAHLLAEAGRLAFADRDLFIADTDFVDMPAGLLDSDYLAARAALIDPARAAPGPVAAGAPRWDEAGPRAPDPGRPRHGTTHFVIVDGNGDALSATTTIEMGFGARLMVNGYLLNNELTDFAFHPEAEGVQVANRAEGGKRPRSSMAPTVVLREGRPVVLIGSPGGANIIPYVATALVALLDWGMAPDAALNRPHVLNRNGPTWLEADRGADALAEALAAMGHELREADLNSGLHAIMIGETGLAGAADRRREGLALGR